MKTLPNNYYDDIAIKWVKDFHANASMQKFVPQL